MNLDTLQNIYSGPSLVAKICLVRCIPRLYTRFSKRMLQSMTRKLSTSIHAFGNVSYLVTNANYNIRTAPILRWHTAFHGETGDTSDPLQSQIGDIKIWTVYRFSTITVIDVNGILSFAKEL